MTASAAPDCDGLVFDLPGPGSVLFTGRAHGNMSSAGGFGHEHGFHARERLRMRLGLRRLARGYQAHGTTIVRIRQETDVAAEDSATAQPPVRADGQATVLPGVGAMALAADCLPVALGSEHAVAMVHAGWRGLAAGVLEEGVGALRELDRDGEIVAIIGPGAGPCCYEVGPEVHAAFVSNTADGYLGEHASAPGTFLGEPGTTGAPIDLKAIARDRLHAVGVTGIAVAEVCTICDERFFSHRREGADAGRNAGVAWLSQSP